MSFFNQYRPEAIVRQANLYEPGDSGVGGVLFGQIADRIGHARALLGTVLIYAVATTACAFAPNLEFLIALRLMASLGIGGVAGSLLTAPVARRFGRRGAFAAYFLVAGVSLLVMFGMGLEPLTALRASLFVGLAAYGVFGLFSFYLPELFPARLRATGSGFTYNFGRIFAAGAPFLVGWVAMQGANAITSATQILFYIGFVPLAALAAVPFIPETRNRRLDP
jgi:MFS family permease